MTAVPDSLKKLSPLLARAAETDMRGGPQFAKLGYYCRFAAMNMGIGMLKSLPAAEQGAAGDALGELMNRVEQDRVAIGITRDGEEEDLTMVEQYALGLFAAADREDRAGTATKETVRTYQAAGVFLDVVRQVRGDAANPKFEEMGKYAKVRALSMMKDLQAGRQPTPPEGSGGGGGFDLDAELSRLPSAQPAPGPAPGPGPEPGHNSYGGLPGAGSAPMPPASASASSYPGAGYGAPHTLPLSSDPGSYGSGSIPTIPTALPATQPAFGQRQNSGGMPTAQPVGPGGAGGMYGYGAPGAAAASSSTSAASPTTAPGPYPGYPQQQQQQQQQQSYGFPPTAPMPGPYGMPTGGAGLPSSAPSPYPSAPPAAATATATATPAATPSAAMSPAEVQMKDAMELAKFAVTALKERNRDRAVHFLTSALATLQQR